MGVLSMLITIAKSNTEASFEGGIAKWWLSQAGRVP